MQKGDITTADFEKIMINASASAKEYVVSTGGATGTTDAFITKQRSVQNQLRSTATAYKTATFGIKALSLAVNMFVIGLISKGIDLASEAIDESRSSYEESVSSIDSMNSELQTTQDKTNDLQSKGTLLFTDAEELENLRKQNDELERSIYLEEKKKQNSATSTVSKIKNHYDDFKDDFDTKYSIYKNDKEQYESAKRDGQRYVDNGTYSIDEVQSVISHLNGKWGVYKARHNEIC